MPDLPVGQRVQVSYEGWEGEGVVLSNRPDAEYIVVLMQSGPMSGHRGGFKRDRILPIDDDFKRVLDDATQQLTRVIYQREQELGIRLAIDTMRYEEDQLVVTLKPWGT